MSVLISERKEWHQIYFLSNNKLMFDFCQPLYNFQVYLDIFHIHAVSQLATGFLYQVSFEFLSNSRKKMSKKWFLWLQKKHNCIEKAIRAK